MAQQESENISSHVKLGLQMKQKRGELIGFNGCLGYDYDPITKTLSVNDEEKKIVQYIYDRYIQFKKELNLDNYVKKEDDNN